MKIKNTKLYVGACKAGMALKKASPQIAIIGGVVGLVGAGIWACKKTLKLEETVDKNTKKIDEIKKVHKDGVLVDKETKEEYVYTDKDYKKDMAKAIANTSFDLVKLYSGPIILGSVSIASILCGQKVLTKRNAVLTSAYGALKTSFDGYRKRVAAKIGEQAEKDIFNGVKETEVTETKVNKKTGEEKEVTKKGEVIDDKLLSPYSFIYCEGCAGPEFEFEKNADYNYMNLMNMQEAVNRVLRSRAVVDHKTGKTIKKGHMFLNEVLRQLGFDPTPTGQLVGWMYDPNCDPESVNYKELTAEDCGVKDNRIDFGILDLSNERFINRWESGILLNMNCDGTIIDKI